jgi:hypothetical protein
MGNRPRRNQPFDARDMTILEDTSDQAVAANSNNCEIAEWLRMRDDGELDCQRVRAAGRSTCTHYTRQRLGEGSRSWTPFFEPGLVLEGSRYSMSKVPESRSRTFVHWDQGYTHKERHPPLFVPFHSQ